VRGAMNIKKPLNRKLMSMEFRILDNGSLQNLFQKNFGLQKYFWNLFKKQQ